MTTKVISSHPKEMDFLSPFWSRVSAACRQWMDAEPLRMAGAVDDDPEPYWGFEEPALDAGRVVG